MAYLSTIIQDIEQHYSVKIKGNYHIRQIIDGIRFLDQHDLHVSYLYPNILSDVGKKFQKATCYIFLNP